MLALLTDGYFDGFGIDVLPHSRLAAVVGRQFRHVPWQGFACWDLIQPSFMFMVGVAIPYALASRRARGDAPSRIWAQVLRRSLVLLVLGLIIVSNRLAHTNFNFADDVLLQIGLAYPFACAAAGRGLRTQALVVASLLATYWLAFALHPLPAHASESAGTALTNVFGGFFGHWNSTGNFAADFDRWFLNLFPRATPFTADPAGLTTLNFVPSIATLIFGVMTGELMRSPRPAADKLARLSAAGAAGVVAGILLGRTICPIVKPIWTPSWAIFSGGCAVLLLAAFYWAIDVLGWALAARPLVVLGINSLAIYLVLHLSRDWIWRAVATHVGPLPWTIHFAIVALLIWLAAYWLSRRKIIITV